MPFYTLADLIGGWDQGELTLDEVIALWPNGDLPPEEVLRELLRAVLEQRLRLLELELLFG